MLALGNAEDLKRRLLSAEREVVFLVGAPLTMPEYDDSPGVADVRGVVHRLEQLLARTDHAATIRDLLAEGNWGGAYREGFQRVQLMFGQDRANDIIREAVLEARSRKGDTIESGRLTDDDWHLRSSVAALGEILVHNSERFGRLILTTNFDPLIEVAIRRTGGQCYRTVLDTDGSLQKSSGEGCHVVYLHGYWQKGDTLHTALQLTQPRRRLRNSLKGLLQNRTVVVLGYSGWDDVMVGALRRLAQDADAYPDILWAYRSQDPSAIEKDYAHVLKTLSGAHRRGRVQYYAGVNLHELLTSLRKELPVSAAPPVKSFPISIKLDLTYDFVGGAEATATLAYQLLKATKQNVPAAFKIQAEALDKSAGRLSELEHQRRTPEQEQEFRHLLKLRDTLNEKTATFSDALGLALGNQMIRADTYLSLENYLTSFLLGIREDLFCAGMPAFPGTTETPEWLTEWRQRRTRLFVWWLNDPETSAGIYVNERQFDHIRQTCCPEEPGRFSEAAAYNIFSLPEIEVFYPIALPTIAVLIVSKSPSLRSDDRSSSIANLRNWVFSVRHPDRVHDRRKAVL